jgi:anti-anti-sigma factor
VATSFLNAALEVVVFKPRSGNDRARRRKVVAVQVSELRREGVLILGLDGRLDAASSPLLERKINSFLDSGQAKLIMNFDHVEYLSSAGMRLLLVVSKRAKGHGGKLVLAAVHEDVMEVIKVAGFDQFLEICHTEGEAIARFQGQGKEADRQP